MVKVERLESNQLDSELPNPAGGKQRKRHRVPISCTICRRRKVKCDKKKPQCTNCKKNGVQHLCRYLEPKWAKPLDEDELKFSANPSSSRAPGDDTNGTTSTNATSSSFNDESTQEELNRLKQKIKELEMDNQELRKNSKYSRNNNNSVGFGALRNHIDTSELVDCILSSNILFTAKPGPKYKFPIVYQISIFSWMFFVRNDSYLNDLWLKILKLRKHYEYYYSSQNAMKDAQKSLENNYFNYDKMNNKIKKDDSQNSNDDEKPVESSSKLKKLLEGSLSLSNNTANANTASTTANNTPDSLQNFHFKNSNDENSNTPTGNLDNSGKCPVLHNQNSFPVAPHPMPAGSSGAMRCPVTGQTFDSSSSKDPTEHPHVTLDDKHTYHLVISKCPILHPRESTISYVMDEENTNGRRTSSSSNPLLSRSHSSSSTAAATTTRNTSSGCPMNSNGKRMSNSTASNSKKLLKSKKKKLSLANNDDLPNSAASSKTKLATKSDELNDPNDNTNTTNSTIDKTSEENLKSASQEHDNNEEEDETDDINEESEQDGDLNKRKISKEDGEENDGGDLDDDDDEEEGPGQEQEPGGDDALPEGEEDDEAMELNEDFENPKVCPLMIGDARTLFKEKLARMSLYAMQEELSKSNSPRVTSISAEVTSPTSDSPAKFTINQSRSGSTNGVCPVKHEHMGKNSTNAAKAKRISKKLKTISPSAIKNLNYNNTKQIIQLIEKHLPTRKVVWLLINRYFDKLYIQLPYVDEESFRVRIASLIDTADSSSQKIRLSSLGSEYSEEFLTICLLLIIIRLSWLSLPPKTSSIITQDETVMLRPENTINMVLVDMVKEVFSSAKIMSKPSLIIFQVGLYLKNYNILAPEDGFDLDDSYSSTSSSLLNSNDLPGDLTNESPNMNSPNFMYMLVQLGRTIGLNRDPLNFKNFYSQSDDLVSTARLFRKRHLWRKLWYGLLEISVEANLSLGDYKKGLLIEIDVDPTLGMVNNSWDCRLPGGVEQGILEKSFIGSSLKKEQIVVQNFRDSILVHHLIYKGMSYLFTNDSPPTSKEIDNVLSKLYEIISENSKLGLNPVFFLKAEDPNTPISLSNKFDKIVKIYKFRMYLLIKSMLFALSYLMFLNHEQKFNGLIAERTSTIAKLDKQKEYINVYFESSLLLAIDNFNIFDKAFENSEVLFSNSGAELMLYPYLMILNHRSHEFLISLILRLQQNSPVIMEILTKNNIEKDELLTRLFNYVETFLDKLEGLTKNYYYAWRLRKLVKFFYNILTNSSKLFKINFNAMNASIGVKDEELTNPVIDTSTPPPPNFKSQNGMKGKTTNTNTGLSNNSTLGNLSPLGMSGNSWGNSNTQPPLPSNGDLQFTTHPDFNGMPTVSPPPQTMFSYSPTSQHSSLRQPIPPQVLQQHQQQHQQLSPQQHLSQQGVHTPEIEADDQFNAFAIAFGTSKLPPVTDYNTPKADFHSGPLLDLSGMTQSHNMMFNEHDHLGNNGKVQMNNLRQQAHHNNNLQNGQQLPPTPQQIHQHQQHQLQQQQMHHQMQQQQAQQIHHHHQQQQQQQQHQQQQATTPTSSQQHQSQQLAEIFDTRFFNELHDLQGGDMTGSNDMIPGFGDPNFTNGSNVMVFGHGSGNNGLDGSPNAGGGGGFGMSYNPLNEIDFTNVDLSSPFDLSVNNNNANNNESSGGKYFNYK